MKHHMDSRLFASVSGAVAALGFGVASLILDAPALGVVAGAFGLGVGALGALFAMRARDAESGLHMAAEELHKVQRDLDSLAGIFAEEQARKDTVKKLGIEFPAEVATTSDEADMVFDEVSGLLEERFFAVIVQQRVSAARRQLQPVSVVLFELDGFAQSDVDTRNQALSVLGEVLRRTLRESDTACRVGDHMAAAVLDDTTEAGAVWAAERVRGTLMSSPIATSLTVSAGVACYPSHALGAPELVSMAARALDLARSRGKDQVEIAPND